MDFSEHDQVLEKIDWLLNNPERATEIGHNASRFIEQHATLSQSAKGFVQALDLL